MPSRRLHTVLTKEQVLQIFDFKQRREKEGHACTSKECKALALNFKVNEKTVRDIWIGRTWKNETRQATQNAPAPLSIKQRPFVVKTMTASFPSNINLCLDKCLHHLFISKCCQDCAVCSDNVHQIDPFSRDWVQHTFAMTNDSEVSR